VGDALKWETYEPDPVLFWRLKAAPNVNRMHMRGYEPAPIKGARDLRIACVGASVTFGLFVPADTTFGLQLEYLLQRELPGARVETVLGGLPGYTTYQDLKLFERELVAFAPDITVFYCGTWNDFMPAVERSDADLGRGEVHSLRTLRILSRVVEGLRGAARGSESVDLDRLALPQSVAAPPCGRRVPLEEFRANLDAMIELACASGEAVLVVPPLAEEALRMVPVAGSYRDAAAAVAQRHGIGLVDGRDLVNRFMARPVDLRPCDDPSPCLRDWVHLSRIGHELIARAVFDVVMAHPPGRLSLLRALPAKTEAMPTIHAIVPESIGPFDPPSLLLEGEGLTGPTAIDRVWIGNRLTRHEIVDDHHLHCKLDAPLPPGEHEVELVTADGLVAPAMRLVVPPCQLKAVLTRGAGGLHLEVSGSAPPRSRIMVWLRERGAHAAPLGTQCGDFYLADEDRLRYGPPAWFCFDTPLLRAFAVLNDETPQWQACNDGRVPIGISEVSLQALITSDDVSALSQAVTLRLTE
jgi:hypothetical protein